MKPKKKNFPIEKQSLHSRNKHRKPYDFIKLINDSPQLASFVQKNKYNSDSIDFFNPQAVKALNKALLHSYYGVKYWDIPNDYLCPPVPGRVDYIHYAADLLSEINEGLIPIGKYIKCLDIGVGANCIYPILGNSEYDWSFVGSDIDKKALNRSKNIVDNNQKISRNIEFRFQTSKSSIFEGIIKNNEFFELTICNPPFHSSRMEAEKAALRKLSNLKKKKVDTIVSNFGGKSNELWCKGGELRFLSNMINESKKFADSCLWFTSLVSKESNLKAIYAKLNQVEVRRQKTIHMNAGNKKARMIAWSFFDEQKQKTWAKNRWRNNL